MQKGRRHHEQIQLFEGSVSKTALWCSESWTSTTEQKRHLRAVQRSMLRRMVGPGRKPDEEYIPWIKRSTKLAGERARDAGVDCWLKQQLRLKWNWAGTIANMTDERWAKRVTFWRDSKWQSEKGTLRPCETAQGTECAGKTSCANTVPMLESTPGQVLQ